MRARVAGALALGSLLIVSGVAYYFTSTSTGSLVVRIHDVPAAWSQITVTFTGAAVHPASAPEGSGWIAVDLSTSQIEFLGLGNQTSLLASGRVAPATFDQLRLTIGSVAGVLTGGASVVLSVSNGVVLAAASIPVHGGGMTTVTVDLNLALSIQDANGLWTFQPVLGSVTVG